MRNLSKGTLCLLSGVFPIIVSDAKAENEIRKDHLNVLLITIDDMNIGPGEFDGMAITPNIDSLARVSIKFTNAHCVVPASNPSRTALFTGLRPETTGQYTNEGVFRDKRDNNKLITLPQYLQKYGYETVSAGKVYHHSRGNAEQADPYSDPQSWNIQPNSIVGIKGVKLYQNEKGLGKWHDGQYTGYLGKLGVWGPVPYTKEESNEYDNAKFCIDYLNEDHDKPFFLACGIFAPHAPHIAPQKYFDMYPIENIKLPEVPEHDMNDIPGIAKTNFSTSFMNLIKEKNEWKKAVQGYLACMSFADDVIGDVLLALKNSKYKDNTIVILLTDNGFQLGHKDRWEKYSLWRMATNVPLIIKSPNQNKGQICNRAVSFLDIYPTLLDMLSIDKPQFLEGHSIVEWLNNPNKERNIPAVITHEKGNISVVMDNWNYIRYKNGAEELYDRSKDKFEYNNLANKAEYRNIKDELSKFIPVDNNLE